MATTKKTTTTTTKKTTTTTTTKKTTTAKKSSTRKKKEESVGEEVLKDLKRIGKREFTKKTGIPTTQSGIKNKIGRWIVDAVVGVFSSKKKKDDEEDC